MKSTVNRGDDTQEITYPRLMIGNDSGIIVLFRDAKCGTVVNKGTGTHIVGHYSENWKIYGFTPFNGSVTLEND